MSDPRAPHPQGPQFPGRPHHAPYQQAPQVRGQLPHPYGQPFPAPPPAPRPVRSLAGALGFLGVFSVVAPLMVMVLAALWFVAQWLLACFMLLITGFTVLEWEGEIGDWARDIFSWAEFGEQLAGVLPWAAASLVISLVVGGLTLVLLHQATSVKHWHPALQGLVASLTGVFAALALSAFVAL